MIIADTMTFGSYFGYFFIVVGALVSVVGIVLTVMWIKDEGLAILWVPAVGLVLFFGALFFMWPLKYNYHHWVEVRGKVTDVNNRLLTTGSGDDRNISQRFVFVIDGRPYGVDDTRATLVKKGETVSLRCKKEHQWQQPYAADGWACRWGS